MQKKQQNKKQKNRQCIFDPALNLSVHSLDSMKSMYIHRNNVLKLLSLYSGTLCSGTWFASNLTSWRFSLSFSLFLSLWQPRIVGGFGESFAGRRTMVGGWIVDTDQHHWWCKCCGKVCCQMCVLWLVVFVTIHLLISVVLIVLIVFGLVFFLMHMSDCLFTSLH